MEVMVVLVILGIAAAIVVPNVSNTGSMTIQAAARMIIADLLLAQNEAVGHRAERRVTFNVTNNDYKLTDENGALLDVKWRGGDFEVDFDDDRRFRGVKLDLVDFGGDNWVTFDELGAPSSGGTIEISSAANRYRITVRPFTGRVTVEPIEGSADDASDPSPF